MTTHHHAHNEQRALKFSLYGVLFFVVLAIAFAILTKSDAILFDGVFSLIGFCMALVTLKVARLAERPDDDQFHFGYTAMEPTLNLFKSLIVITTCVFALVGAVNRLLAGGNPAEYGIAVIYGVIATAGCFTVAWLMYRSSQDYRSDLVQVEAKTWFVDGLLSASVLIGFIVAWLVQQSSWAHLAPLVDPLLLIVLVVLALPIPGKIMWDSLKEVIAMAPPEHVVQDIEDRLLDALQAVDTEHVELRVSKRGRVTYLLVHVIVGDDFIVSDISELDSIRRHCEVKLKGWNHQIMVDMLFIRDGELAGVAGAG
jgi:cation diffusion facilitator family transporter